jgi:hypothetical protein
MQLVTVASLSRLYIPPPLPPRLPDELLMKVQLVTVG